LKRSSSTIRVNSSNPRRVLSNASRVAASCTLNAERDAIAATFFNSVLFGEITARASRAARAARNVQFSTGNFQFSIQFPVEYSLLKIEN